MRSDAARWSPRPCTSRRTGAPVRVLGVLSNRIWIFPQSDRAADPEAADVLFRCGSQAGKVATHLPMVASQEEFDAATTAFVIQQIADYRTMVRKKQKNPTRGVKKCFDREQIAVIDTALESADDAAIAASIL